MFSLDLPLPVSAALFAKGEEGHLGLGVARAQGKPDCPGCREAERVAGTPAGRGAALSDLGIRAAERAARQAAVERAGVGLSPR